MSGDITQNLINDKLQQIIDRLGAVETRLAGMDARLASMDARLAGMDARLADTDARLAEMDARLEALEAKGYDTKPIWERALAELIEINRRLDSLDRRFSVLNDDVLQTRADQRKLEERVGNLEQTRP